MNRDKLLDSLNNFSGKKIAVFGDVALDKYVYGRIERINPENPAAPLVKIQSEEFRMGCAANVAKNIASLGAEASLFCVLGEDFNGAIFEKTCRDSKIKLLSVKEGRTIVKKRIMESEFNRCLLRSDEGESALTPISESSSRILLKNLMEQDFHCIILSDYNKKMFKGGFSREIIQFARERNIPVIVDPKPDNIESFRFSTLMCPNIKEAKEISNLNASSEKEIAKKLKEFAENKYVLITLGEKGMMGYDGEFHYIPTKAKEVLDVTGAGDTVCAILGLSIASGLNLVESAQLANYGAGIAVEKTGTYSVRNDELRERISIDGEL